MSKLHWCFQVLLWSCLLSPVRAQEERPPMETDRPHVSEAASVVGEGTVQLEAGFLTEVAGDQRPLFSLPTLLRVGVSDIAELRLESDSLILNDQSRLGMRDLNLGAKVALMQQDDVSLALLMRCGVHTAARGGDTHLEPGIKLLLGAELSETLGLEVNLGVTSVFDYDNAATRVEPNFAVALTQGLDENWSVFGEMFGAGNFGQPLALYGQSGVLFMPGPDTQWDFAIIRGLTPGTQPWGFGLGYSQRF